MSSYYIAYPKIAQKRIWVPLLIFGGLVILGGLGTEAQAGAVLVGGLIMLFVLFKLGTQQKKQFKIDEKGLSCHEFGVIPWSDIQDLSWTIEELQSGGQPMPQKWHRKVIMYIDVYNMPIYWDRLSWNQKRLHRIDKTVKSKDNRLRKSLKLYTVDQDELARQACLLFYEYKQEKPTICYLSHVDPTA